MAAEGTPQREHTFLARSLGWATSLVLRGPHFVLGCAVLLAVVAIVLAINQLGFRASRLDLLNPNSSYNKRWLAYLDEFGQEDDVVVVVEGNGPQQITPVLDELAETIARDEHLFFGVLHQLQLDEIARKGLHLLTSTELKKTDQFLSQVQPVLENDWNWLAADKQIRSFSIRLRQSQSGPDQAHANRCTDQLMILIDRLRQAIAGKPPTHSFWPRIKFQQDALLQFNTGHLLVEDGRLGLILLRIARDSDQLVQGTEAIDRLRALIADTQQRNPQIKLGLTGIPILENDEMRSSQQDMLTASFLSLFGVACLFVAGFGGLRYPLMTVSALILAIAWSFGYVTLVIGHLNILSVSFGVILIGLGIDFGIHYVARYLQLRHSISASDVALIETARSVGPGVLTGGITTALAFSTAALTHFTGVAELGVIAGGGILLCIIAALLVLPAMIYLSDRGDVRRRVPSLIPLDTMLRPLTSAPRVTLLAGTVVTGALACGVSSLRFDHNLLNMQPAEMESVELERRLIADTGHSVWFALCIADTAAHATQLKERFEQLDSVQRTEEVASLLPATSAEKLAMIRRIAQRLAPLPANVPIIPVATAEQMDQSLLQVLQQIPSSGTTRHIAQSISELRKQLEEVNSRAYFQRLALLQQQSASELLERLQSLRRSSNPAPPSLADLPEELRMRFVGENNRFLIRIYPRNNIWNMSELNRFIRELESVEPHVTGHPVQTFYASRQLQQSYVHAAIYSLLAVTVVLVLNFCDLYLVLLALLPMGLGALQLLGLLGLLGIPLNAANMIVLPLILGIGIDDGVHVIHDFRRQTGRYQLSRSTATAVLITSATTMVGFGTMMFAKHQGLRSLGQVLTIGVFCCLGTSIVLLPALLSWMTRNATSSDLESRDDPSWTNGHESAVLLNPVEDANAITAPVLPIAASKKRSLAHIGDAERQ